MWSLMYKTIKDSKLSLIIYTLVAILFIWMLVGMFPSIKEKSAEYNNLIEAYPEAMTKIVGLDKSGGSFFTSMESFLAIENFSIMWPIMAIALVISLGSWAIAGQIETKTMGLLLSYPLSRTKIFLSKYLSGFAMIIVFSAFSVYLIIPFAKMYNLSYNLTNYTKLFIICLLFAWAIYAITMLFSAIFSDRSKTIFASVGVIVVMYALTIISALKDNLDKLKYGSFFHYFDYNSALINNSIPNDSYFIFLGTIIFCTLAATIWFSKRDIYV